jgi:hypothetical protein
MYELGEWGRGNSGLRKGELPGQGGCGGRKEEVGEGGVGGQGGGGGRRDFRQISGIFPCEFQKPELRRKDGAVSLEGNRIKS